MEPLVSIVVPLFNRENLIEETIQSVVSQTCNRWELIIVDDGSTDSSFDVAQQAADADSRIRVFRRTRPTKGACTCRNEGLERARGKYVLFLDSDDLLGPACLQERLRLFKENEACDFLVFFPKLFLNKPGDSEELWGRVYENYLDGFLRKAAWITIGVIWKKDSIEKYGGWKERLPSYQDWELHIRALTFDPDFRVFDNIHNAYLRRGEQTRISKQSENAKQHLRARKELIVDIRDQLVAKNQISTVRKKALVKQLVSICALSRLSGDKDNGADCIERISEMGLVKSKLTMGIIKCYAVFESNSFLRRPLLTKTLRRAIKLIFVILIPSYIR